MRKCIGFSGGFVTRAEALLEAKRRRRLKKYKHDRLTVPKRRIEGYYRIRYQYSK